MNTLRINDCFISLFITSDLIDYKEEEVKVNREDIEEGKYEECLEKFESAIQSYEDKSHYKELIQSLESIKDKIIESLSFDPVYFIGSDFSSWLFYSIRSLFAFTEQEKVVCDILLELTNIVDFYTSRFTIDTNLFQLIPEIINYYKNGFNGYYALVPNIIAIIKNALSSEDEYIAERTNEEIPLKEFINSIGYLVSNHNIDDELKTSIFEEVIITLNAYLEYFPCTPSTGIYIFNFFQSAAESEKCFCKYFSNSEDSLVNICYLILRMIHKDIFSSNEAEKISLYPKILNMLSHSNDNVMLASTKVIYTLLEKGIWMLPLSGYDIFSLICTRDNANIKKSLYSMLSLMARQRLDVNYLTSCIPNFINVFQESSSEEKASILELLNSLMEIVGINQLLENNTVILRDILECAMNNSECAAHNIYSFFSEVAKNNIFEIWFDAIDNIDDALIDEFIEDHPEFEPLFDSDEISKLLSE